MTDEEIFQELGKIVVRFRLLQCKECAREVRQWLKENGISGKILLLRTVHPKARYIVSDRQSDEDSITDNGKHYGVEVKGKVFDNLSSYGLERETWLKDFSCRSGQFVLEEVEVF
jgi:hypothetical protein